MAEAHPEIVQLRRLARRVSRLEGRLAEERALRDGLIVSARERGVPGSEVAAAAGVSEPYVSRLAKEARA